MWGGKHFETILKVLGGLILLAAAAYVIWYIQPISGTVMDKRFVAAHYETRFRENCITVTTGKTTTRSCTSVPYQVWVGDRWTITVCNEDRCKGVNISQIRYDDIHIGDQFSEE